MAATAPMCQLPRPVRESIRFCSVSVGAPEHLSLHAGKKAMHFHGQTLVPVHSRLLHRRKANPHRERAFPPIGHGLPVRKMTFEVCRDPVQILLWWCRRTLLVVRILHPNPPFCKPPEQAGSVSGGPNRSHCKKSKSDENHAFVSNEFSVLRSKGSRFRTFCRDILSW